MKQKRIIVIFLAILTAFSLLTASLVMADTLADDEMPASHPHKEKTPAASSQVQGGADIAFQKTVGLPGSSCSVQPSLFITQPTRVYYCYRVTNTGAVTLTLHDLIDSRFGVLINNFPFALAPTATVFLTASADLTTTTFNTAAWTAFNPGPTDVVTRTDSAHVYMMDTPPTCSTPNMAIPDNDSAGVSDVLTTGESGELADLDVYLDVTHTWVGDLVFTLTHEATGTEVRLFDRPGNPASTFGCSGDNLHIFLDDEALETAEDSCQNTNPAYPLGSSYQPSQTLSLFNGLDYNSDWRLTVSDNAGGDVGVVEQWCLLPTIDPDIQVDPPVLTSRQGQNSQVMRTLLIHNNGDGDLNWHIYESFATALRQAQTQMLAAVQTAVPGLLPSGPATEEVDETADAALVGRSAPPTAAPAVLAPTGSVLFDNGPLVNYPGAGDGGADVSAVQSSGLGMSTFGFSHQIEFDFRVADEFTVTDANGWVIDAITFYAYETSSPPVTSTITAVHYQIWDGPPNDPGSQVIYGDLMTNRLVQTGWSGIYRTDDSTTANTLRPIMMNQVEAGFWLPPGTYWLEWQTGGSDAYTGPWIPPVTISGTATTGNALQYTGVWAPAEDGGTTAQQGFPFILSGSPVEDIPWVSVAPISGTTDGNTTTPITVIFDSTGLSLGVYTGTLHIQNDDPDTPFVSVPLTLTVDTFTNYLPFVIR